MEGERLEVIERLTKRELEHFEERTKRSLDLCRRSVEVMPLGVPTNVCALSPYPVTVVRGSGAEVTDIDGNRYIDYHNGFGTSVTGHAHPAVTEAVIEQAGRGTHFGTLTEPVVPWAELICVRYGLDWVRFSNSGTEATMDAVRLARAHSGRIKVAKIEGGYHGSHDVAMVSPNLPLDGSEGPDEQPSPRLWAEGLSPRLLDEVVPLPFNDLEAAERALAGEDVACILIEPILFNVGAIFPRPGYLEGLRELCDRTGALLIFDETKTGATIAWGGAQEVFGVEPDIKTLGKGIGGGLPVGALGGTKAETYDLIEQWRVPHLGTFSGNPLTAAAGLATLEQVLTPESYEGLERHGKRWASGIQQVIDEFGLAAYVVQIGAKGCIVWADHELVDYRDYKRSFDGPTAYLAWLWFMSRNILLAPGHDEQTTHSVCHTDAHADGFIKCFREFAEMLRAELGPGVA